MDRLENWDKLLENYNMQLLYCAYIEGFDVLTYVYCMEQLSDSFVEDFDLKDINCIIDDFIE